MLPHHVPHRQIRDRLPIGQALPGVVRHGLARQVLPELRQQTRLPHAGVPDDPNHLSLALRHLRQASLQQRQLPFASDKAT